MVEKQENKVAASKQASEKGYKFKCAGCGIDWEHKVKKTSGLCVTCVGLRRANQSFLNAGTITSKDELLARLQKLLT